MSTQNKFSDNFKSPIFTQNYLLQITISLAKSNNLRSPLEMIPLHNKFNLHIIPNNSLHLNPAIFQIPLPHLPKTQQSLPIKIAHHSPISTKIITQNTYLEVHNINLAGNTVLNCVKLLHNSNHKNSLKNTSQKNLEMPNWHFEIQSYQFHINLISFTTLKSILCSLF